MVEAQVSTLCEASHKTDTWASLAVLALKKEDPALKLHCILPCEEQADGWSVSARELYFSILNSQESNFPI